MHTRQDAVRPAQPQLNPAHETSSAENEAFARLRALLAPNWAPLEKLCPPGLCEQFMFMGCADGIYLYKHVDSRRYLNLDVFGRTYAFNPESRLYYSIDIGEAMRGLAQEGAWTRP